MRCSLYALRSSGDTSLLISPSNIPFDDEGVRGAFFSQVGERERFNTVISADLTGRKAKVKVVDNRIAQDAPALSLLKVGTLLASAVLMYSFGARNGEDRGVMEQEVTAACLAPGLDRNTITAALSDLREQLLYLHYVGRRYRFETKANLNKLIADEEGKIATDDVLEKIRTQLSKFLQNSRGNVVLWPKDSMAISDRIPQFSIAYLAPDWAEKSHDAILSEALTWLEQRGKDKREYKNALAFVVPNKAQMDKALHGARTASAIASLLEQKAKYKFTAEDLEELNGKVKDAASEMSAALRRLYEYILLPLPCKEGSNPIRLEIIDLQSQLNTSQNLQDRALDALKNHVFDSITPVKLIQHSGLNSETGYVKAEELVSYFFRFPTLPKMLDVTGIRKAVIKAIGAGIIGYVPSMNIHSISITPTVENPNLISFKQIVPDEELDLSGYLLSSSLVTQMHSSVMSNDEADVITSDSDDVEKSDSRISSSSWGNLNGSIQKTVGEDQKDGGYKLETASSLNRSVLTDIINRKQTARHYKINLNTNKSKIFDVFQLLQILSDKADEMTIQIEVRAILLG